MIEIKTIDGLMLREMAVAGSALLEANRAEVDALNVFPVPDGDTGTNMSLTMQSAVREISAKEYLRADEACAALSKGALKGARGNSGVITSQLLRGFAKALNGIEHIGPADFARAMKAGSDLAYKAVMKPKEGTILTVARVMAEDAMKQAEQTPDDYDALFNTILKSGAEILKKTPDMLPALKDAGVVDSGGRGLLYIYTGYAAVLRGESIEDLMQNQAAADGTFLDDHDAITDFEYDYHVSYTLQNLSADYTAEDVESLRRRLNRIGNMVNVEGEEAPWKIHVHTNNPGGALSFGVELGEVTEIEVLNMPADRRAKNPPPEPEAPPEEALPAERKPSGMVAVSLGDGFSHIFRDLGVDVIVEGGQTMNPSIDDILQAINRCNADTVYVFPNNGNVVMAANQAAEIAECSVFVIPTKNVAMGIAAAVAYQPDSDSEANVRNGSRGQMVELLLNGEYRGIYNMCEPIDRKQLKLVRYEPETKTFHGQIWDALISNTNVMMSQLDSTRPPRGLPTWAGFRAKYPDYDEIRRLDWTTLVDAIRFSDYSDKLMDRQLFIDSVGYYFDVPVMQDYFIFIAALQAIDNGARNIYYSCYDKAEHPRMTMTPWDLDVCLGQNYSPGANNPDLIKPERDVDWISLVPMVNMWNLEVFRTPMIERYKELRETWLNTDNLVNRYRTAIDELENCGAAGREEARWSGDTDLAKKDLDLSAEMDYVEDWIRRHMDYLDENVFIPLPIGPDFIPGDVNGDGEVNIADVNTLIDIILGGSADEGTMKRADVNGDSEINIADVNTVIDMILG